MTTTSTIRRVVCAVSRMLGSVTEMVLFPGSRYPGLGRASVDGAR